MFLALREIRHSRARFILITVVIFLVSFLVYFLTGLAHGLSSSYTEAIEGWKAHSLVMTKDANKSPTASHIDQEALDAITAHSSDYGLLSVTPSVLNVPGSEDDGTGEDDSDDDGEDTRENVFIFGLDPDGSLAPTLKEGRLPAADNELVIDADLVRQGLHVGDTLTLPDVDTIWTITGVSAHSRFQATPTVTMTRPAFEAAYGEMRPSAASAVVLHKAANSELIDAAADHDLEVIATDDFVDNLPGYRAQNLTFGLMIGSLIAILTLVLGIFVYVLTIQKKHIFGIMKAQGVRTSYIVTSGVMQTLVLAIIGVGLGLAAAAGLGMALQGPMPFRIDPAIYGALTVAFIVFTVLGGLIPIRTISRIDPIEVIDS